MEPDDRSWFHVTAHSYGAWLYGDPRGFRTRHHREHVEGDYKNPPPPALYQEQYERSQELLKQAPVVFSPTWRLIVGEAFRDRLEQEGSQVLVVSASGQHVHALAKLPPSLARHWVGLAKRHATFVLHERGWQGLVWAKRSKETPIKDRKHHVNVFNYILRHADEGAWVWSFRDRLG
jgi:REP element-mobilizing transposase RayT